MSVQPNVVASSGQQGLSERVSDLARRIKTLEAARTVIKAGVIQGGQIGADAITANNIAAGAITSSELAANSITSDKIVAGSIVADDIAAGSITANEIAANAITATKIAAGAIAAGHISAGAITAGAIAAGAISTSHLSANSVTAGAIQADSINAGHIQAGAVTASELAANSVTANSISAGVITTNHIATGTISATNIASSAITADKIAAGAVTSDKITVTSLSALSTNMGSITGGTITGGTIQTAGSGSRVVMNSGGLTGYGADGVTKVFEINAGSGIATFMGTIQAGSTVPSTTLSGSIPGSLIPAMGGANYLKNSGAEKGVSTNWGRYGSPGSGTLLEADTSVKYQGTQSFRLTAAGTVSTHGEGIVADTATNLVSTVPGRKYTVSAYVRTNVTRNMQFIILWRDSGGTIITSTNESVKSVTANTWDRLVATVTAPANTATMAVYVVTSTALASGNIIWIDAVQAEDGEVVTAWVPHIEELGGEILPGSITQDKLADGSVVAAKIASGAIVAGKIAAGVIGANEIAANAITAAKIAAGTITATEIASGAITASKLSVTFGGQNMLAGYANTNFETTDISVGYNPMDLPQRHMQGTGTFAISTAQAYTGTQSLLVTAPGTYNAEGVAIRSIPGPFRAGRRYILTAYVRLGAAFPANQYFNLGLSHSNVGDEASASYYAGQGPTNTGWYRVKVEWVPSADRADVNAFFRFLHTSGTAANSFYLDNIQLEEADVPSAYTAFGPRNLVSTQISPGAITTGHLQAGSITASKISFDFGGSNMVWNSSFEDATSPGPWEAYGGNIAIESGGIVPFDGTRYMTVTKTGSAGTVGITSASASTVSGYLGAYGTSYQYPGYYPIISGRNYTLSGWVASPVTSRNAQVEINWYDKNLNWISATAGATVATTVGDGGAGWTNQTNAVRMTQTTLLTGGGSIIGTIWTRAQHTATAPANAAYARVGVYIAAASVSESHFIDGVQFEPGDLPMPFARRVGEVLPGSVGATQITPNSITTQEIMTGTIQAADIASSTITATQIASGTITAANIAAGAITADKITMAVGGGNMLSNSGFDDGTSNFWTAYNNLSGTEPMSYELLTETGLGTRVGAGASDYYIRTNTQGSSGSPKGLFYTGGTISYAANTWYVLSFWYKGATPPDIHWNTGPTDKQAIFNPAPSSSTWQRYAWRIRWATAPTNNAVWVGTYGGPGHWKAIQLEQGEYLTAWSQRISPTVIDGSTITGATIRTSVSGTNRVEMTSTGLRAYNSSNQELVSLTGATGLDFTNAAGSAGTVDATRAVRWMRSGAALGAVLGTYDASNGYNWLFMRATRAGGSSYSGVYMDAEMNNGTYSNFRINEGGVGTTHRGMSTSLMDNAGDLRANGHVFAGEGTSNGWFYGTGIQFGGHHLYQSGGRSYFAQNVNLAAGAILPGSQTLTFTGGSAYMQENYGIRFHSGANGQNTFYGGWSAAHVVYNGSGNGTVYTSAYSYAAVHSNYSDRRHKTNIRDVFTTRGSALARVKGLRPRKFDRAQLDSDPRSANERRLGKDEHGFIAQEVAEIDPDLVGYVSPDNVNAAEGLASGYTLNPMAFIALLAAAIKDLSAEVDELKRQQPARP